MTIKEVKLERDQISKEKDDLSRQLADVTHSFEMEIKKRENIERSCLKHVEDIDKLKARITEYEKQIMALRRQNDELDTRVKTGEAKITTIENSLSSAQTEIRKITELNDKLQKEKQHMMR
ncbi:Spindle- and centromere-associated protein [Toxocara canis]|uniref:Spindle-and centromere-associated protein n=1 Tax=Toxocara canis TaxID=6265 RepID=A0A0B2VFQ0_TOXCA|nr:Spindle- and centromere-associated protein [Toxocara canis]